VGGDTGRRGGRTKGSFDDADLCCGGVKAGEGTPVVDDETSPDDVRATVDGTGLCGVRCVGSADDQGRTTKGTWSRLLSSFWSCMLVWGCTRPPWLEIAQ
jgi:hypothetical protein